MNGIFEKDSRLNQTKFLNVLERLSNESNLERERTKNFHKMYNVINDEINCETVR